LIEYQKHHGLDHYLDATNTELESAANRLLQ